MSSRLPRVRLVTPGLAASGAWKSIRPGHDRDGREAMPLDEALLAARGQRRGGENDRTAYRPGGGSMENKPNPHENEDEILNEAECARRLSTSRETLSRLRKSEGLPWFPLREGRKPRVRYVWREVVAWARARSRNLAPVPRGRGRPRNVDRSLGGGSAARPPRASGAWKPPPSGGVEVILVEAECARRLSTTRETLSRLREGGGLPWFPLCEGDKPRIRYVWSDVFAWAHARLRNSIPAPRRTRDLDRD